MKKKVLLVGAGPMAVDYAKVLKALGADMIVVGRGESSSREFEEKIGQLAITGGLEKWLKENGELPERAIIAVSEQEVGTVAKLLLSKGVKHILAEKPGGLDPNDILSVRDAAKKAKASVFVAYNRRFYAAVKKAKEIITADGGVISFNFEFTEWSHVVKDLAKANGVKENWFLLNSTHVIDLAFYLGGKPKTLKAFTSGGLSWHPSASIYAGAGVSDKDALFSYQANWEAPGRWALEVLTKKSRLIFRPMEKLQIQKIGSVAIEEVPLDNALDLNFKPGLYKQTEAWLNGETAEMIDINGQAENLRYYDIINGREKNQ